MARVKQPYDDERFVPGSVNRLVQPGEVVEVPDDELPNYLEAGWQPGQDKETKALVEKLRKAQEPPAEQQQDQGATPGASGEEQAR